MWNNLMTCEWVSRFKSSISLKTLSGMGMIAAFKMEGKKNQTDQQQWCHTENSRWESIKSLNILVWRLMFPRIIFHIHFGASGLFRKLMAKTAFINLETRRNADSFLQSIRYRSAESLVSVQSILVHQSSMPLYTPNKCKKAKPWRINQISRSEKHSNWVKWWCASG